MNELVILNEVKREIDELNVEGKISFLWCVGKYLVNDYILFFKEVQWGDSLVLEESLKELWLISINENRSCYIFNNKQKIGSLLNKIEPITPDFDEFMDFNVLSAFNACSVVFHSLKYCLDNEEEFIEIILENIIESLKYKVELIILKDSTKNINYSENDPFFLELEAAVFNHAFFKEELNRFRDYLTLISIGKLDEINCLLNNLCK